MVEVAVIGSGAAGLVAARHLLRSGLRACLFDSRDRYGGAWSTDVSQNEERRTFAPQMWSNMVPNLSRYTCAFSDFPWPSESPLFPSLTETEQYLQDYANQYLWNDSSCRALLGCTVTHVSRSEKGYKVDWQGSDGLPDSQLFDGVVVATGFLSEQRWPNGLQKRVRDHGDNSVVIHAAQYKDPEPFENLTVAVVGGSFSAHEIASDVRRKAGRVINIMGSTYHYILPRFIPFQDNAFAPIDWVFYRRQRDAPCVPEETSLTEQECQNRHALLRRLIGSHKLAQLSSKGFPDLPPPGSPPMVSISDKFVDLVIDDKIEVIAKRLEGITFDETGKPVLTLSDGATINGIDRIILCTGYRCNLDFLASDILQALEYDGSDDFAPFVASHEALHPDLPGLGFVGMYRGAYFGVMDLQARLIATQLAGNLDAKAQNALRKGLETSRDIRKATPQAQFPHFDYIGMMDSLSQLLGLTPPPEGNGASGSFVSPAFYQPSIKGAETEKVQMEMEGHATSMMNLGKATLSALVGKWSFERVIDDRLSNARQAVNGVVRYSFQDEDFNSLRYREDGFLLLPNGNKLDVFREYDYQHHGNGLDIFFVESGERAHLFLSLMFERNDNGTWMATSDHLCINDLYKGTFAVVFDGVSAQEVTMSYRVKGPKKDYESVTILRPLTNIE